MKRVWIVLLCLLLYIALVVGGSYMLHLEGKRFMLFNVLLILLGVLAAALVIWYLKKMAPAPVEAAGAAEQSTLDAMVRDADAKLKQANRPGRKVSRLPAAGLRHRR